MKVLSIILICIVLALCAPPTPTFPKQFSSLVTETYGKESRQSKIYYDATLDAERFDRTDAKLNISIIEILRYDSERRFVITTNSKGDTICESSHLVGHLPTFNFTDYTYDGQTTFDSQTTDKWSRKSAAFTFSYYDTVSGYTPVARVRTPNDGGTPEEVHYTQFIAGAQNPRLFDPNAISTQCTRPLVAKNTRTPNLFSEKRVKLPGCSQDSCSYMQSLSAQYFSSDYQDDMICIAYYESSWCPAVYNGICCYGLWQINSNHIGESGCPASSPSDLYDPNVNAQCAVEVLNNQGLNAWQTWSEGDCNGWNSC